MTLHPDRRDFLKTAVLAGAGVGLEACRFGAGPGAAAGPQRNAGPGPELFAAPPLGRVRVGFVGVGHQGSTHVQNFLRIDNVDVVAICDVTAANLARSLKTVTDAGRQQPKGYGDRGLRDFERMIGEENLDLVFTATPWEWHAPVMLAAMRAGKHAATEVPLGVNLDEVWELVETAEQTRRHCVMMENCCYDRPEMMIFNMMRQGLFGELLHAECGYLHDLRRLKLSDFYYDRWRVKHSIARNGDLYPTHGIGPVAQWMDVNRGNQFDYLVSMASKSRGLNVWAAEHIGANSPEAKQTYALGDVVTTLIRTKNGQTIQITHDTDSPRPYSRNILLQGTKGLVRKYPEAKIYVEGRSPHDRWEELQAYRQQYDHPLWKGLDERAAGAGHGGMDYIEDFRLVQCLRQGAPMDMDIYDGAAWTAVIMLSEQSIAERSRSVDFPDFTRGSWRTRPPLGIIDVTGRAVAR
ncbi:MAG: Gfo/Idh/MocA family oxidoreductase [Gemmatimonadaceae bacterium]|nr:Gfo/Idh/MocA family oxidoreductase [Gemmatimonadaceae bacterium]MBA3557706.1 Gfo/Idh/MocA family oxidoreductase [Gemmatimonadaceae bacterium]